MIFVTVAARNYMPKALVWAQTLRAAHPDAKLVLCQPERELDQQEELAKHFDLCLTVSNIGLPDFSRFCFRHSLLELATAIKPRLMLHLLNRFPAENKLIFLDPDTWTLSRMEEVETLLENEDILLTPHLLTDEDTVDGIQDNVFRTLRCGIFNLGFLAVRRGAQTTAFLNWWMNKTELFCQADSARGLFVDQRWVDLAMSFFKLHVLQHPGYNVANWNLSKRALTGQDGHYLVNGSSALRFFHFSGIDGGGDARFFRKYAPDPNGAAQQLRARYKGKLKEAADQFRGRTDWSYASYYSGETISDSVRSLVRQHPVLLRNVSDPYAQSNEHFLAQLG